MSRPRSNSVPVTIMIVALVLIAIAAVLGLRFGDSVNWLGQPDPPAMNWEAGDH